VRAGQFQPAFWLLRSAEQYHVGFGYCSLFDHRGAQMALALAALVAEQMAFASLMTPEQSRCGNAEALFRSAMRFHLGHIRPILNL
jgi:hypothetical protein